MDVADLSAADGGNGEDDSVAPCVCALCGKPMLAGEAHYSITGNHDDCQFPQVRRVQIADDGSEMNAIASRLDEALLAFGSQHSTALKPRKPMAPEGTGPTAMKTQALAVKATEAEIGAELTDASVGALVENA